MAEVLVYCGNQKCGVALNESPDTPVEKRQPCPKCGALLREFDLRVSDEVNVKSFIDIKKKSPKFPSDKKQRVRLQQGDQINHKTGEWILKGRRIDKDVSPAWYTEILIDTETGEIEKQDELLSDHWGHGSDKKK